MMQIHSRHFLRPFLWIGCAALLAWPAAARALGPGGDVYFGYSRLGANTFYANTPGLNGWEAAGHIHLIPFFGAELDVAHYGLGAAAATPRTTTVLLGPRLTVGVAGIHLFVHGLAGWEHTANNGAPPNPISSSGLAVAAGGGVDFRILPFFAWRINADYINAPMQSPSSSSHDRFGTGLVFRF
ncbi:MAG: hypothetical protein ACLGSH_14245 [Acidobacteriota bacterium]